MTAGPQSEPVLPVMMLTGRNGTVVLGQQADVWSKARTAKGHHTGVGRERSASIAAAPPSAGGAAGGQLVCVRQLPSSLGTRQV